MLLFYNKADALVVNSSIAYKDFKKFKNKNVYKIYSPIDLSNKSLSREKNSSKFKIISVGRLEKEKNFTLLIEAFSKLSSTNIYLDIYGEGALGSKLQQQIKKLNLSKKLKLKNFKDNTIKIIIIIIFMLVVLILKDLLNTVVEAIKNDLPVISTNSKGGVFDILQNGKGGIILKKMIQMN